MATKFMQTVKILRNVDTLRRVIMRNITKNIGKSNAFYGATIKDQTEIKRILISRPNHRLGNLLLLTPLIQEITSTFPECKIDLFVKGTIASVLFNNYDNIHNIIQLPRKPFSHLINYVSTWMKIRKQQYDLVINVSKSSSSGRLSTKIAKSKHKIFGDDNPALQLQHFDYQHSAKNPVYNFKNYLSNSGLLQKESKIPTVDINLSPIEISEGSKALKKLVDNDKPTICLFTYATKDKCYSQIWWEKFFHRLRYEYPNHNIIEILPIENESKISYKAPVLYSTDVRQIAALIANTDLFIGADSGIMHLANSSQTATVGLFSVTDPNVYQPYGNLSVAINTITSSFEDWFAVLNSILTPEVYQSPVRYINETPASEFSDIQLVKISE